MGLADYEVRGLQAWYRHITLVMIVEACLAGICAAARISPTEPTTVEGTCPLLPLTIPEVRHVLAYLRLPATSQSDLAAGLVVVATLPPEPCQLLSYPTSVRRRVRPVQPGHTTIISSFARHSRENSLE
jgi:hypothetical protein